MEECWLGEVVRTRYYIGDELAEFGQTHEEESKLVHDDFYSVTSSTLSILSKSPTRPEQFSY